MSCWGPPAQRTLPCPFVGGSTATLAIGPLTEPLRCGGRGVSVSCSRWVKGEFHAETADTFTFHWTDDEFIIHFHRSVFAGDGPQPAAARSHPQQHADATQAGCLRILSPGTCVRSHCNSRVLTATRGCCCCCCCCVAGMIQRRRSRSSTRTARPSPTPTSTRAGHAQLTVHPPPRAPFPRRRRRRRNRAHMPEDKRQGRGAGGGEFPAPAAHCPTGAP